MTARIFFALLFIILGPQAWAQTITATQGSRHAGAGTGAAQGPVIRTPMADPRGMLDVACLAPLAAASVPAGTYTCKVKVVKAAVPVVVPPPPPPPPPPPAPTTGAELYFSPAGSNANPGTQASPKRDRAGVNFAALPAGAVLRFERGGSYPWPLLVLENLNATPANPIVFEAYGTGARPVWTASGDGIYFGMYQNTSFDGGYTFRGIEMRGPGQGTGMFLQALRYLTLDDMRITGFGIGIQSQADRAPGVHNVTILNSDISQNGAMGILGQFSNSRIEGNTFRGNNVRGSGFDHGTYLSGKDGFSGVNLIIRNNHYDRNSVLNGRCEGGNMTFHGQMTNVLIERNIIEQDAAAPGCWGMSITQAYDTAEWFREFTVRGNTFINLGNNAMNAQSAPGIVVEGNVVINTQSGQSGLNVGHREYSNGDVPDGNAIARNNTGCYPGPGTGNRLMNVFAPNSTVVDNVTLTGAAATQGACAR